jgi:hypothetical protein
MARHGRPPEPPPPLGSSQRGDDLQASLSLSSTALGNSGSSRPVIAPPGQARRGRNTCWIRDGLADQSLLRWDEPSGGEATCADPMSAALNNPG